MHPGSLVLDDALAGRLVAERFPELSGLPLVRAHTAGTVNAVFRIGEHLAARFPLVATTEADLIAEADALAELAAATAVPAPRPYGVGGGAAGYASAWSVQTWVPGETAAHDRQASSARLAEDVAALVESLRRVDTRGRGFDGRGRGGELADHDEWMALCFERSAHLLDVARARALWAALRNLPPSGADVMSHRDLTPFNLLVDGDRLAGVLDGGSFGPADPALDLVAAWHLFDAEGRRVIRERLWSGDVEWFRGAAWALQQAMGLVWYYEETNPAMSALGLSTMRRLLADAELTAVIG